MGQRWKQVPFLDSLVVELVVNTSSMVVALVTNTSFEVAASAALETAVASMEELHQVAFITFKHHLVEDINLHGCSDRSYLIL